MSSEKVENKTILLAIPQNQKLRALHMACVSEGVSLTALFNCVLNEKLDLGMDTTSINIEALLKKKSELESLSYK